MTSSQHFIHLLFNGDGLNLEASGLVNVTVTGVTDADGDGLPDSWESQFAPEKGSSIKYTSACFVAG